MPSRELGGRFSLLCRRRSAQLHVFWAYTVATMAAPPAVVPPIADPSAYIVTSAFVSQMDYTLLFAVKTCGLPGVPPRAVFWPRDTKFGLGKGLKRMRITTFATWGVEPQAKPTGEEEFAPQNCLSIA